MFAAFVQVARVLVWICTASFSRNSQAWERLALHARIQEIRPGELAERALPATAESIIDNIRSVFVRIARRSTGFGKSV